MNELNILDKEVKMMSSKEICEVTGKLHKNTLQLIRKLQEKGLIRPAEIQLPERINNLGHKVKDTGFELNKSDSILVVAQQSPEFTAALIARWEELENQKVQLPQTYVEALQLAA